MARCAPDILLATREPSAFGAGLQLFELEALDLPELGDGPLAARVWREDAYERSEITGLPEQAAAPSLEDVPGAAWLAVASGDLSADDPLAPARIALQNLQRWPQLGLERVFRHPRRGHVLPPGPLAPGRRRPPQGAGCRRARAAAPRRC